MKNILDKMASRGVEALSDRELLALLTDDEQLAEVVLSVRRRVSPGSPKPACAWSGDWA